MHLRSLLVAASVVAASFALAGSALAMVDAAPVNNLTLECTDHAVLSPDLAPAMFVEVGDAAQCDHELLEATGFCLAPVDPARVAFAFVPRDLAAAGTPACPPGRSPAG